MFKIVDGRLLVDIKLFSENILQDLKLYFSLERILFGIILLFISYYIIKKIVKRRTLVGKCWNCGETFYLTKRQVNLGWKCPTRNCHSFNSGPSYNSQSLNTTLLQFSIYSFFLMNLLHITLLFIGTEQCKTLFKMSIEQAEFKLYITQLFFFLATIFGCTIGGHSIGFCILIILLTLISFKFITIKLLFICMISAVTLMKILKINNGAIEMEIGDEQDFERYVEERYLQKQYKHQVLDESMIGYQDSNSEIEDEDFSKLSLADPNSDSEEMFSSERDVNPWAKEDKFKKPPKYAVDFRQIFNDNITQSIPVNPPTELGNIKEEVIQDENMTDNVDNADKTGENQIIDRNFNEPVEKLHDTILTSVTIPINDNENQEQIETTSLLTNKIKTEIPIEKATLLSKWHYIGITSFLAAVISVLVVTCFDLYQTARHG